MKFDQRLDQRQPEAAALVAAGHRIAELAEGRDRLRDVGGRDADAAGSSASGQDTAAGAVNDDDIVDAEIVDEG